MNHNQPLFVDYLKVKARFDKKMNDFDEDGSSIILSQLHQQEIQDIQKTVNDLTKENLKLGTKIIIFSLKYQRYRI